MLILSVSLVNFNQHSLTFDHRTGDHVLLFEIYLEVLLKHLHEVYTKCVCVCVCVCTTVKVWTRLTV
jgi:hypothetical protein